MVSFLIFPVRARSLLERQMATSLIQIGDLTVWLVGQVCGTPAAPSAAGSSAVIRMQGSSGTDSKWWVVCGQWWTVCGGKIGYHSCTAL